MLAATAAGNPGPVAGPVTWSAHLIGTHPGAATAAFGTVQLLLALGIAWRPTVRVALAASIAWALAVWWLGEGLGGVLTGSASPVTGAPGAALLYALAAVLLCAGPARGSPFGCAGRTGPASSVRVRRDGGRPGRTGVPARPAGGGTHGRTAHRGTRPTVRGRRRSVGAPAARALWFALWGGLTWLAVLAARGPGLLPDQDPAPAAGMSSGEPRWLRSLDAAASGLLGQHAALAALVSASLFAVIAVGVYLPVPAARAVLCLAVLAALAMWAGGQDLGGLFTRATTDPDTGPLLVLLAAAYWPVPRGTAARERSGAAGRAYSRGSPEPRPLTGVR